MRCRCKLNQTIPYKDSNGNFLEFTKGKYYDYTFEEHKETGSLLYKIDIDGFNLPIVKDKFHNIFCDIQEIREEKLNIIFKIK